MAYKFSGMLYNNSQDLAYGIAAEFFGQHTIREILKAFSEDDSHKMAQEAIDGWSLQDEDYIKNGDVTVDTLARALDRIREEKITDVLTEIEADDVRQWGNCEEAEIDDKGDVWIAKPQTGHWLKSDARLSLALWVVSQ